MACGLSPCGLALKGRVDLLRIESDNNRAIDDNHGSGHIAKFLEFRQRAGVLGDVSFLKLYSFLRKILLRQVAEHSPVLRINDDALRQCTPPAELTLVAFKR